LIYLVGMSLSVAGGQTSQANHMPVGMHMAAVPAIHFPMRLDGLIETNPFHGDKTDPLEG